MSGWFAVKHGISRHHLFQGRPERMAVWIWLVDNAVYKDTPHDINGKTVIVPRGSVAASERHIAKETGVSYQVVRTFLARLRDERMINARSTHGKNIISLCNYEKYQSPSAAEKAPTNAALTHDQRTKEQVNNIPVGTADKSAVADPEKIMWTEGVKFLVSAGRKEGQSRSLLGKWKKAHGAEAVLVAIGKAQREGAIEPVEFIEGIFRHKVKTQAVERDGYTNAGAFGQVKEFN